MQLYLRDQSANLCKHLQRLQAQPIASYNIEKLKEKKTIATIICDKELTGLSFNFLLDYNIFPGNILSFCAQWEYEKRTMQAGDTIVQQVYFPPIKFLSQKIIVGVRIKEVFKNENLIGFSYETIKGHIEKGISSFQIYKSGKNLTFAIHTYSKANNLLLDILSPLFSSPYQDYCTKKALQKMIALFKIENL